ncbi:MAG TPA: FecR domain-containing protein [Asticcacaulis sp.]|nr:FecR domain-containing protein [Asticcacaulis sp.]
MSRIDDEAAAWVARRASGRMDDDAEARFAAWHEADARHQGAFLRAEATWLTLGQAQGLSLATRTRKPGMTRRLLLTGAAAASISALVGVGLWRAQTRLSTKRGELRNVPLQDRSLATINTDSQIAVAMTSRARHVELVKGEAWFQVAKNPEAPFVVAAGDVRVRAVGTAFSVRRHDHGADVLVTEGVVETWRASAPDQRTQLNAGDSAFVPFAGAAMVKVAYQPAEVTRKLAWREREIILRQETLSDAAAEFNRYNDVQIVIADPALGQERLVGGFSTDQPDSFARAVHAALDAPVSIGDGRIVIGASAS